MPIPKKNCLLSVAAKEGLDLRLPPHLSKATIMFWRTMVVLSFAAILAVIVWLGLVATGHGNAYIADVATTALQPNASFANLSVRVVLAGL